MIIKGILPQKLFSFKNRKILLETEKGDFKRVSYMYSPSTFRTFFTNQNIQDLNNLVC